MANIRHGARMLRLLMTASRIAWLSTCSVPAWQSGNIGEYHFDSN
jgi:hypothetical protein